MKKNPQTKQKQKTTGIPTEEDLMCKDDQQQMKIAKRHHWQHTRR